MQFDDNLISSVEDRYPLLIARTLKKLKQRQFDKASGQLKQLVELWEVILRYLATIVCRTYIATDGKSTKINDFIKEFRTPSNGHWLQLLRECSKQFKDYNKAADAKVVPTPVAFSNIIHNFYFDAFSEKRNNPVFKHAMALTQLDKTFSIQLSPNNGSLFDLILRVRNWMAHTASRTEEEYKSVVGELFPIIMHILKELNFLSEFPAYYVKEVKVERGEFNHNVDLCMGRDFEIEKIVHKQTPLMNDELYVFGMDFLENGKPEVKWALSLCPYLIVERCPECHQQQMFIFNKIDRKKLEFVSYQCGHLYIPPEHLIDFEEIFDFLEGKIDIHNLLKGKAIGTFFASEEHLAFAPESRNRAKDKIEEGRKHLAENQLSLALESFQEAIELDTDNAEARFLTAMCNILNMGNIEMIIGGVKKALALDPENSKYSLSLAEIYAEINQPKNALQYLRRTIEIDPSNQRARELLGEINGSISSLISESEDRNEDA